MNHQAPAYTNAMDGGTCTYRIPTGTCKDMDHFYSPLGHFEWCTHLYPFVDGLLQTLLRHLSIGKEAAADKVQTVLMTPLLESDTMLSAPRGQAP